MQAMREQAVHQAWSWLERFSPRVRTPARPRLYPSLRHADMLACLFEEERAARQHLAQVAAEAPSDGAAETKS